MLWMLGSGAGGRGRSLMFDVMWLLDDLGLCFLGLDVVKYAADM